MQSQGNVVGGEGGGVEGREYRGEGGRGGELHYEQQPNHDCSIIQSIPGNQAAALFAN